MHYTAGFGMLASFTGARSLQGDGFLLTLARTLLEAAGALFALYLLVVIGLVLVGVILRRTGSSSGPSSALTGNPAPPGAA
jgi:hypothetical protein